MIKGVMDHNGVWCDEERQIGEVAVKYFDDIFSASPVLEVGSVVQHIDRVITNDMNKALLSSFTAVEVREAMFQMHPSKAPGPDGMSSFFYQKYWNIVGPDVIQGVLSVLNSGYMLQKINHSHIVLIPKKKDPQAISDYRPISLSNVVYKLISKVLANRLKGVLPHIISESQSAFVPGRQITDNINTAFEMLHYLRSRRKGKVAHMAIKLDMSKAYDRVEWAFLERVMQGMGFAGRWIHLLMMSVCSASYSVLVNGEPTGC